MRHTIYILIAFLFVGCDDSIGEEIVKIPEASGISYCSNTDTLIVANDEGTYYEITPEGRVVEKVKLGKYDLEGVVCEDEQIIFVREDKGLLLVERKTGKKKKVYVDTMYAGKKRKLFDKKSGIEGLAKVDNILYLSKQAKKKKNSFIAVVRMKPYPSRIMDIIEHGIVDVAGLTIHNNTLYMVSDKKDLLIKYNLEKKKIEQKVKLEEGSWEGIAFDTNGNVYLADDDGRVMKYTKRELGL